MGYTRKYGQTTRNYNTSNNSSNIKKKSSTAQQDLVCSIHANNKDAAKAVKETAEAKGTSEGAILRELFQDREATSQWIETYMDVVQDDEVNKYLNSLN